MTLALARAAPAAVAAALPGCSRLGARGRGGGRRAAGGGLPRPPRRGPQGRQRRWWSEGFRRAMAESEIDCVTGAVPYWEGHPLTAVLFGWPGSTPGQLAPYMQLYDRMGVPCVALCPSLRESINVYRADLRASMLYAELQVELCNLRSDLLFHFFSTTFLQYLGGAVYFCRKLTKGIVFDSAPTMRIDRDFWHNCTRTTRALQAMVRSGVAPQRGPVSRAWVQGAEWLREVRDQHDLKIREMTSLEMMFAPQLYMYCEDDPLLPRKELQELIEYNRERKGMKVWEVVWPGDRHLGHLQAEPVDYETVLRDFVQSVAPLKVEQLEVGRNAGAEWPPAVPTDEEMRAAHKWSRPYISPYHEHEVTIERELEGKRSAAAAERAAIPEGQAAFRYPDGAVRPDPPELEDTAHWIAENTPELPHGVQDLSGRADVERPTVTVEQPVHRPAPIGWEGIPRDYNKP
eukprot:TRINITY_DN50643_c0_g1_i1.p1 TRINITY_DN50643_c0_g1~~TRINITY_DN50643_c0_g1_i1.p1  ORF type:complete len:460 (+),score=106.16 TRINITY_DN50643_c0_g1_i1:76-1455(+)